MRNTLEIECLGQALENYMSAKTAHDKARDSYEGYSWGYHGHSFVQAMEDAAEDFQNRLDKYISEKVAQALANKDTK